MRRVTAACFVVILAAAGIGATALAQQQPQSTQQAPVNREDRVVITGMVPVPDVGEGAPLFTTLDIKDIEEKARDVAIDSASDYMTCSPGRRVIAPMTCKPNGAITITDLLACEVEYGNKAANLAFMAAKVTAAAEDSRRAAARGEVSVRVVEETELARQEAVNKMNEARQKLLEVQARMADFQNMAMMRGHFPDTAQLDAMEMNRKEAGWGLGIAQPDVPEGLSITNIRAVQSKDKKGDFVVVQGEIRNGNAKSAKIPNLSTTLVDDKGWPLATTSVSPSKKGSIPAGKSYPFAFEVRPAPQMMRNAVVSFAPKRIPPPRIHMNGLLCPRG